MIFGGSKTPKNQFLTKNRYFKGTRKFYGPPETLEFFFLDTPISIFTIKVRMEHTAPKQNFWGLFENWKKNCATKFFQNSGGPRPKGVHLKVSLLAFSD